MSALRWATSITAPAGTWKEPAASAAALPAIGNSDGDVRLALAERAAYAWGATDGSWLPLTGTSGANVAVTESLSTGWPERPGTSGSVTWIGWTDPTTLMQEYDIFVAVPTPLP